MGMSLCTDKRDETKATAVGTAVGDDEKTEANKAKLYYTITDEAPALATRALLPIIESFVTPFGIEVAKADISLAGRIISLFPDRLKPEQRVDDWLAYLGVLALKPEANIIKLPNISASVTQLHAAIKEIQSKGFDIPNYPAEPKNDAEKALKARYAKVLGSAVNPVLREGNSDRRVAGPVKEYAKKNPHRMLPWKAETKTHVSCMMEGDFYASEQSKIMDKADTIRITHVSEAGDETLLKDDFKLQAEEVIDAQVMSVKKLRAYFEKEILDAKKSGLLFSVHLKATMMKISDPIIFGHCTTVYYKDVFEKHAETFAKLEVNANNGIGDVYTRIQSLDAEKRAEIEADIKKVYETRPGLAMVDSDKGITNLHVSSNVIIDASMPVVVRDSGCMWNAEGKLQPVKCCIPDRSYGPMFDQCMTFCRKHGQFDVTTMGNVANVGLMAQKAEEYGSHDKTFEIKAAGNVVVTSGAGEKVFSHKVEKGDIWRMCQTRNEPIKDWVKLGVSRARATGNPAVFFLDPERAHDRNIMGKAKEYLKEHDTKGLEILFKSPTDGINFCLERVKAGKDTITVTGNVLRDYLTDLFPILELGTSAKMLSIVPLLAGGGLFETGAGGSAPKHVQQFVKENHLRWDSLGEYLALGVSLESLGQKGVKDAGVLGKTLTDAVSRVLDDGKSPGRKVNQPDNRTTNYYLAMYWAEELTKAGKSQFKDLGSSLRDAEKEICQELLACQGKPVDLGGYYMPDDKKADAAMNPSPSLNAVLAKARE